MLTFPSQIPVARENHVPVIVGHSSPHLTCGSRRAKNPAERGGVVSKRPTLGSSASFLPIKDDFRSDPCPIS